MYKKTSAAGICTVLPQHGGGNPAARLFKSIYIAIYIRNNEEICYNAFVTKLQQKRFFMQTKNRIFFIVSIVLFAVCIGINAYSSIDYYSMYSTQFTNIDNQFLSARYLESQNGKGIFIAGDLGHNKGELSMTVHEFARRGYGIWIFDFPSQGLSKGTIPFMYKESESRYLAEQFYSSIVAYTQLADMRKESIHMIGFGEGARAMLEAAALNDVRTADMTLIGTDINLTEKVNFDFLSFTNDSDLEWVKSLSLHNPGMKIHLIASKFDRASKINDNKELMKKLTAAQNSEIGRAHV